MIPADPTPGPHNRPWLNKAVIAAALVMFGGAVLTLVQPPSAASANAEPKVLVRLGAIERAAGGHVVEFEAVNTGDAGASRVFLKGMLMRGDEVVETSNAALGRMPAGSTQPGGFYFMRDPVGFDVEIEADPRTGA